MRARNIKPAFFKNETIGTLPYECRILFIGLWLMADKDGFLEYRPLRIKAEIFPYDNIDSGKITELLEKLCNLEPRDRLIEIWLENGEHKFIQIINFKKHQSPHKNEMSYKIKELFDNHETPRNFTNFHVITGPFNERGMMNDESGIRNDEELPKGNLSADSSADDKIPSCPHKKIISLYNEKLGNVLPMCKVTNKTVEANLRARWREDPIRMDLGWWAQFFNDVYESDFLMGRINSDRPFHASFDWLIKPSNMAKVINGNYRNKVVQIRMEKITRAERNRQAGEDFVNEMTKGLQQ